MLFFVDKIENIFTNCWPLMWANGIRIKYVSPNVDQIDVQIRPRWFLVNVIRTLFGRSLFTMTEPFYMLILLHQIKNYNYNNKVKNKYKHNDYII